MNTFLLVLVLIAIGFNFYTLKLLINSVQKLRSQTRAALHNHQGILEKLVQKHSGVHPFDMGFHNHELNDIADRFRKGEDIFHQVPRMRTPPGPPSRGWQPDDRLDTRNPPKGEKSNPIS